jgi:hypothetical protein
MCARLNIGSALSLISARQTIRLNADDGTLNTENEMTLTAIQALESALYALNAVKNTPLNKNTEPNHFSDTYSLAKQIQQTLRKLQAMERMEQYNAKRAREAAEKAARQS